jgi:amidohydrolase
MCGMGIDVTALYRDLHQHPELGFAEHRTAAIVASTMRDLGLVVTESVGGTGVVAVLSNGAGPVVCLRADMDGLPVLEKTGLDYASSARGVDSAGADVPVMHACGHDVHMACLVGAVESLVNSADTWSGTLLAVFQPAEETAAGARAMVDDALFSRFPKPVVVLGQHVAPLAAGTISVHSGVAMASSDSFTVTLHGRGGHGSRPHTTIDPIVAAAHVVTRLQTVVAREVEPGRLAVVTVGRLHAGSKSNVIPATAALGINMRATDSAIRDRVLASITRIVNAEADASGMPERPTFHIDEQAPVTINDPGATERTREALEDEFQADFGPRAVVDLGVASGSEDVGLLAEAAGAPLVFWFLGGADPQVVAAAVAAGTVDSAIPSNHSPFFAPVIEPTIAMGVRALSAAARAWFDPRA